jgi:hypothetical protein
MCESAFNTAGERQGMCEPALRNLTVCNKNQQNTYFFHQLFNSILLSSTRFECVLPQEYVYMQFYGIVAIIINEM